MSHQIELVAILYPAPGKLDEVVEHCEKLVEYVKANEPGTIRYQFFIEQDAEAPRIVFKETFENAEAKRIHGECALLGELVSAGAAGAFTKPLDLIFIKEAGGFPRNDED